MKTQINKTLTPIAAPAVVVSVGDWDNANLITLAWVGRIVSDPPTMSISIRPSRHSYSLIEELGEYVINIPFSKNVEQVDFCGTRTGKKVDKWDILNLTKEKATKVSVPLIKEFPINIECKVVKTLEIGTHMVYLGEVHAVNIEEYLLDNGELDPKKQNQLVYIPRNYYTLKGTIERQGFSTKSNFHH
ncbi:MAG: flavin reductase family protein [Candidatus Lokiarchaeota archaeon]|nr:flavin reductase family protein [Candidatus Lokiarchaeota archaeon]